MTYQTLETTPLTPHIGAEVDGIDLSATLSPGQQQDVGAVVVHTDLAKILICAIQGGWQFAAEFDRLTALGVRFTQNPTDLGSVITAVFDDTCGNLLRKVQLGADEHGQN